MKYGIVIIGGAADRPAEVLGDKTPLQAVKAPALTRMGQTGRMGQVRALKESIEPGADSAVMSLLGYDPAKRYTGRAPLTAVGLGIDVPNGSWVMHLSLIAAPSGDLVAYDDDALPAAEAQTLMQELLPQLELPGVVVHPGFGAMHVLVDLAKEDEVSGAGYRDWSPVVSAPPSVVMNRSIRDFMPVGDAPGERLQQLIAQSAVALENHEINQARIEMNETPVTHLWPWGLGQVPVLPDWTKRFGKSAVLISRDPSVRGLAQLAGLDVIDPPRGESIEGGLIRLSTDSVEAVEAYDVVIVHADEPALAGLDGNVTEKVEAIHLIDEHVLQPMEHALAARGEHRLMATPLYAVPTDDRTDATTPVPFVITGYKMAGVVERPVTEAAAATCDLQVEFGHELMEFFLKSGVRG
jgi:2,3-bisphosphoglycerate-independent phosphoglycerate mutase